MDILPQLIVNGVIAGSIYAIVGTAFNLTFATGRFFNLALGSAIVIGGYGAYAGSVLFGAPLFLGILLGVAAAGLYCVMCERVVFRTLRNRNASGLILIIASLGIATATNALLAMLFSSQLQSLPNDFAVPVSVGFATLTVFHIGIIVCAAVLVVCVVCALHATAFGRAVRAVSDDSEVAVIVGINVDRIHIAVAFLAGCMAGIAGVLIGMDTGLEPTMGLFYFLGGVIGSIVGGIGSVGVGWLGSFFEGVVENSALVIIGGEWKNAIAFVLLIGVLVFRPRGVFRR